MTRGFSDVKLKFDGQEYTLPANRILMAVAEIEETLRDRQGRQAVQVLLQSGGPSYAKLSMAYAAVLSAAGADVTADDVYLSIQSEFARGKSSGAETVQTAIFDLLAIMSPPIAMELSKAENAEPGEEIAAE